MNWRVVDDKELNPIHRIRGARLVQVVAHIRNNATREIRHYQTQEILDDTEATPRIYTWSEGNFSCDCNRELFFLRAKDEDDDVETKCGDDRFSVNLENPATSEIYYREFD